MNIEIRYASKMTVEKREGQGGEMALVGYAATYNALSKPLPQGFVEKIAPGAFDRALAEKQDVHCLFNHDPNKILGRTSAGTLMLSSDAHGLAFRCILDPNQEAHRALHSAVARGDIDACSFAFSPNGETGHDFADVRMDNGQYQIVRTLKDVNLYDVSAVLRPAYNDTSLQAREQTMSAEIRSIVNNLLEKRAESEKRDGFNTLEDYISAISKALAEKFPCDTEDSDGCCSYYGGKYYICETHVDHVIATCNYCPGPGPGDPEYVSIPYSMNPDGDGFVFGTPVPVEKTFVPADRMTKLVAERRAMHSGHMKAIADQHAAVAAESKAMAAAHTAAADEHSANASAHQEVADDAKKEADRMKKCEDSMGDCDVKGCRCQNCMVSARDVDDDYDDEDYGTDGENESDRTAKRATREVRKHARFTEQRDGDAKVRTKTVDGKALPASAFAFVGSADDTSTWKLPVHDKAHADNAAARLNQTAGIPADKKDAVEGKIKAAQKKFGETSDTRSADPALAPMSADEIEDWKNRFKLATL